MLKIYRNTITAVAVATLAIIALHANATNAQVSNRSVAESADTLSLYHWQRQLVSNQQGFLNTCAQCHNGGG